MRSLPISRSIAAALTISLAACSGGAGTSSTPPAAPAAPAAPSSKATLTVRFEIPQNSTSSAVKRSPQYLSYGTKSIVLTVQQGTGAPTTTVINTGSTSANCAPATNQPTLVCTAGINAPVGSDTIGVTAYDQPQGPNATAPYTGNVLSSIANFPATVTAGTNTSVVVTLTGTPVTSKVTVSPAQAPAGAAASAVVNVFAFDADGYLILGNYGAPIALADSDKTGVTTLSVASVSASGAPVTLAYTGGALPNPAAITSTVGTTASPAALFSVLTGSHDFLYYGIGGGNLSAAQVYDFANTTQTAGQPANNRTVQPNSYIGTAPQFALGPKNELFFTNGDFYGPQAIPVPAAATETGNTTPTATLAYVPPSMTYARGVDISPDGRLFEGFDVATMAPVTGLIAVWPEGTSGNTPPAYSFTTTDVPKFIRFDAQGNLWALGNNAATEYSAASLAPAGAMHPISPITTINYNQTPAPVALATAHDIAFDAEGNIYFLGDGVNGSGGPDLNVTQIYGFPSSIRGSTISETAVQELFSYNNEGLSIDIDTSKASPTYDSIAVSVGNNSQLVEFFQTLSQQPPTKGSVATPYYTVNLNTDGNATGGVGTNTIRFGH